MRDHELREQVERFVGIFNKGLISLNDIFKVYDKRIKELENPTKKCSKCGQEIKGGELNEGS